MAVSVCGCACSLQPDGSWVVVQAAPSCPHGHLGGERGFAEGVPARVTGVGECVTVVFDRQSRTAMLLVADEVRASRDQLS